MPILALMLNATIWGLSWWPFRQFEGAGMHPLWTTVILYVLSLIVVLASQCTGNPQYAGEQDNDPAAATDCTANSPFAAQVRIAELQVYTR